MTTRSNSTCRPDDYEITQVSMFFPAAAAERSWLLILVVLPQAKRGEHIVFRSVGYAVVRRRNEPDRVEPLVLPEVSDDPILPGAVPLSAAVPAEGYYWGPLSDVNYPQKEAAAIQASRGWVQPARKGPAP